MEIWNRGFRHHLCRRRRYGNKFAKYVLQRCADNSFREVRFSYDLSGYPNEVHITVYMNRAAWKWRKKAFEIRWISEEDKHYNIVENPEKYRIEIF